MENFCEKKCSYVTRNPTRTIPTTLKHKINSSFMQRHKKKVTDPRQKEGDKPISSNCNHCHTFQSNYCHIFYGLYNHGDFDMIYLQVEYSRKSKKKEILLKFLKKKLTSFLKRSVIPPNNLLPFSLFLLIPFTNKISSIFFGVLSSFLCVSIIKFARSIKF